MHGEPRTPHLTQNPLRPLEAVHENYTTKEHLPVNAKAALLADTCIY